MSPDPPSISQVNKAGRTLRAYQRGELVTDARYRAALSVLRAFRAAHSYPLTKANMGLRSMVLTEGCRVEVSQRLKRVPTILDKLMREPTMQLANMQDIGGWQGRPRQHQGGPTRPEAAREEPAPNAVERLRRGSSLVGLSGRASRRPVRRPEHRGTAPDAGHA